jgi:hypothetical protein
VVYGPSDPFRTAQGTIRQWRNEDLAEIASGRRSPMGRRKVSNEATGHATKIQEASLSVWISSPGRVRIEKTDKSEDQHELSLTVVNGEQWWRRDDQGHVETSEASQQSGRRRPTPGLSGIERHFDHGSLREYFVGLILQQSGLAQTAGRNCLQLRAVPRPGAQLWPHWLPYGADEYEFHADPERGILLYVAGRHGGEVFEISEVLQVVFDERLDDGLFTYTPKLGEQVRPADPIVKHLSLQAAVAQMSFTVLVPVRLPDPEQADFQVMYHPPCQRSPRAHLCLMYRGDQALWIYERDAPDPELAKMEWELFERDGKRMAMSDPGVGAGMRIMALEQHGTHVTILSDLDREQLIDLAASLVPASGSSLS